MVSTGLPRLQVLKVYCPKVETILVPSLFNEIRTEEPGKVLDLLQSRNQNVEAEMDVGGMKMERIKNLVVSFDKYTFQQLDELRKLVEEAAEMTAENQFWELEI